MSYKKGIVTKKNIDQYNYDGFFVLEQVIPSSVLDRLRATCDYFVGLVDKEFSERAVTTEAMTTKGRRYLIANRYKESPWLKEFLFSELMKEICMSVLGENVYLFHEQWVVKPAKEGMSLPWHQDSGYVPFQHKPYLSCWCTLDNVSEENGTLFVLPTSRSEIQHRVEHVDVENNSKAGYFGSDSGIPITCPAGSIVCFSSVMFHRSCPNKSSAPRRIYLPQYSSEPIVNDEGVPWALTLPFPKNIG